MPMKTMLRRLRPSSARMRPACMTWSRISSRVRLRRNPRSPVEQKRHFGLQAEIQSDDRYLGFDEIVDFRNVPTFQISVKGLKKIGKAALKTDHRRPGTRVAFIVSTSLAVNLVKLYAMYRNFGQMPKKYIRAFKKEDDAYGWLRNKKNDNN